MTNGLGDAIAHTNSHRGYEKRALRHIHVEAFLLIRFEPLLVTSRLSFGVEYPTWSSCTLFSVSGAYTYSRSSVNSIIRSNDWPITIGDHSGFTLGHFLLFVAAYMSGAGNRPQWSPNCIPTTIATPLAFRDGLSQLAAARARQFSARHGALSSRSLQTAHYLGGATTPSLSSLHIYGSDTLHSVPGYRSCSRSPQRERSPVSHLIARLPS
ncbi:hypothetical protein C8R44DRAFT_880140 [Mycena epipterygia]|nr:hypothetical protein C8R44DRAFT_880140 [Mycena epipterygia]